MTPQFNPIHLQQFRHLLEAPCTVAVISHVGPDGDAVGSTQAMRMVLEQQGHNVTVLYPTAIPEGFRFTLHNTQAIIGKQQPQEAEQALMQADVILCLDFNTPQRVDLLASALIASPANKVLIDHHLYPNNFASLIFSYSEISSTCLLLYHLFAAMGWQKYIHRECAEAIYLGMMTDTGGFSYNSEDPDIYTTLSDLLQRGIRKDTVTAQVMRNYTVDKIRLNAHAVLNNMKVIPNYHTAILTLTHKEKKEFNYKVGDTEGLVNVPLEAKEIVFSIFIYEVEDYCKISLRSKGNFASNVFAQTFFNGGGHLNASGGEVRASIEETYKRVLEALEQMHPTQDDLPNYDS